MSWRSRKQVTMYIMVSGCCAYVLSVALSAIFIVALPMAPDWCRGWHEYETGPTQTREVCMSFKNEFEQSKYYHNLDMVKRNKMIVYGGMVFWFGVTALLFHLIPAWKGLHNSGLGDSFVALVAMSLVTAVLVPWILSAILPPPNEWFPQVFRDMNDAQVQAALKGLR